MQLQNLRTKKRIPNVFREVKKKIRLRIYQQEPWEPEYNGKHDF